MAASLQFTGRVLNQKVQPESTFPLLIYCSKKETLNSIVLYDQLVSVIIKEFFCDYVGFHFRHPNMISNFFLLHGMVSIKNILYHSRNLVC